MSFIFQGVEIPANLQRSLDLYANEGVPTGRFLRKCLENDLMGACGKADLENFSKIGVIAAYIYNELPSLCHGSKDKVDSWLEKFHVEKYQEIGE